MMMMMNWGVRKKHEDVECVVDDDMIMIME